MFRVEKARLEGRAPSFFALLFIIAFASVNGVFYTPGLPMIQRTFGVSPGDVKMTMTLFLLGYAFGQLIYGPLANRFGRKRALYLGIAITLVGNLMCALSGPLHTFALLLWGRLVLSLGSCAGLTLALTIITDYYYQKDARKIIAYVTLGFAAIPGIAIAIGGSLINTFGWESAFWGMVVYAALGWILAFRLPETGRNLHPHATKVRVIAHRYFQVFKERALLRYGIVVGLVAATNYILATAGPFIGSVRYGLSEAEYGLYYLIITVGLVIGGVVTGRLAHHVAERWMIAIGLSIFWIGSLLLTFLFLFTPLPVWAFFSINAFIFLAISPIWTNGIALATSQADDKATASSAVSFLNMGTAVLAVFIYSLIPANPGPVFLFSLLAIAQG
ncbi:MAG: MFS transporter [Parachlamydiales bacterium]